MPEDRLVRSRQLGYLCGEDQDPSDYCNQRHHEEGFGNEPALTKRNLHRIQQLDDEQDDEDLIKKVQGLPAQSAGPQGQHHTLKRDHQRVTVELLDPRVLAMQRLVSAVASRLLVVRTLSSVEDLVYVGPACG